LGGYGNRAPSALASRAPSALASRAQSALTGEASYEDRKLLRTTHFRTPYHAVPASPPLWRTCVGALWM